MKGKQKKVKSENEKWKKNEKWKNKKWKLKTENWIIKVKLNYDKKIKSETCPLGKCNVNLMSESCFCVNWGQKHVYQKW